MEPKIKLPRGLRLLKNVLPVIPKKEGRFIMARRQFKPRFPEEMVGSYWMK